MFNTKPANQAQAAEKGSLPYLQARNRSARINLLLILFLTLVNIAMLFADGESYYLFSALLPYWLVGFGYYQEVTALIVAGGALLVLYLVCFLLLEQASGGFCGGACDVCGRSWFYGLAFAGRAHCR